MDDISVTPPPATTIHTRLASDFDAGINTSAVWTESLERDHSLSDEELDEDEGSNYSHQTGRPARALYALERHHLPLLSHPNVLHRTLRQHCLWFHNIPENGSPVSVGAYLEAKVSTDLLVLLLVGRKNGFSMALPKIRSHHLSIIGLLVNNM